MAAIRRKHSGKCSSSETSSQAWAAKLARQLKDKSSGRICLPVALATLDFFARNDPKVFAVASAALTARYL